MKIHQFRNSKGVVELSVNIYDDNSKRKIEKFFGKDLKLINKELEKFNCITKNGEDYTMEILFLDFAEE